MTTNVSREQAFSVLATNFSISPSSSGYTLQVSADGVNYSDLFAVGANVTRMVTGVASGSFYKLRGNTDTNVIVNWQSQCNDGQGGGGGSEYILPAATQSTLGGVKVGEGLSVTPDGTLSSNGGGDSNTLQAVGEFNPDAQLGDVQAKYKTIENEVVVEGELFSDGIDLTGKQTSYIYVDDANGVEFSFSGGRWSISWANEEFSLNLVSGEDNITGVYSIVTKGDSEDGWTVNIADGDENVVWNMFIAKVYEITDYGFGSDYTVPAGREGTVNYTYMVSHNEIDGLYQYDGEDWQKQGILIVDELPEVGNKDTIYSLDGVLYIWNPNAGYAANWYKPLGNTQTDEGTGLVYAYPIEGQIIFNYSRNDAARVFKFHNGDLVVYEADEVTVVQTITLGSTFSVTPYGNSFRIYGVYEKNYIGFRRTNVNISIGMAWDGYVNGGHYEVLNVENHPYTDTTSGIPEWDDKGNVIKRNTGFGTKNIYVNATGSSISNRMTVLTNGTGNGPDRWFAPVTGGNAGQMLISGGDAAPVWSDWIKVVKITSDAYEALATKDPNTLYLIDDE